MKVDFSDLIKTFNKLARDCNREERIKRYGMKCVCRDFKESMWKVNIAFGWGTKGGRSGYSGKLIKYCPWCGLKLKKGKHRTLFNKRGK